MHSTRLLQHGCIMCAQMKGIFILLLNVDDFLKNLVPENVSLQFLFLTQRRFFKEKNVRNSLSL